MEERKQYLSWFEVARREVGVKELRGIADNPRIVTYHATTTLRATEDEVPWCSSFVNFCMKTAGYDRTKSAAAKSWLNYGKHVEQPFQGCIVIMKRPGGHHVGFYDGEERGLIRVLGGNQDDAVNTKLFRPNIIIGYVMPLALNERDKPIYEAIIQRKANGLS